MYTTMITAMLDDFLIRAALAGVGVALAAGPLGALVVWRRMAYFSDATAHAAILGVAGALALNLPVLLGTTLVALAMAGLLAGLAGRGWALDTLLGVLAHAGLAFGLIAVAALPGPRVDLMGFLFGDILAVGTGDLVVIWGGAVLVLALLAWRWNALLLTTVDADLAAAAGLSPARERLVLTLVLALVVAVALKVVGALLIGAMLIIPAAAARSLARSPESMAVRASIIGGLATLGGLGLSLAVDAPTGPAIIAVAAVLFALLLLVAGWRRYRAG